METAIVRLIVKAPDQQIEDQIIRCELGWTIGRLKDYLTEVYPSKPTSSEQKLIYSGQVLNDSAYLKDILRQYDTLDCSDQSFTVHLVCTSHKVYLKKVSSNPTEAGATMNTNTETEITNDHTRPDRLLNQTQGNNDINAPPSPAQFYSTQQQYGQLNGQQMIWMQQAYMHYLTQYMQLMTAQGVQLQSSVPYIQPMNMNGNDPAENNQNNIINDDNEQQARQAIPDVVDPNLVNNNGVRDNVAARLNRDWLDFFYMLSRVVVLFSIVYFYSSPLRFLIVTFLGFAIYLYQGGFFRIREPILLMENNNGRADNNNQILQNEVAGVQAIPPQQQEAQTPVVQLDEQTNPNEGNDGERPGALAFTWTFISSFFASLIPDQPNVI